MDYPSSKCKECGSIENLIPCRYIPTERYRHVDYYTIVTRDVNYSDSNIEHMCKPCIDLHKITTGNIKALEYIKSGQPIVFFDQ